MGARMDIKVANIHSVADLFGQTGDDILNSITDFEDLPLNTRLNIKHSKNGRQIFEMTNRSMVWLAEDFHMEFARLNTSIKLGVKTYEWTE